MSESGRITYDEEFLSKTYSLMLSQEKSAALGYLNQAVNWQITIFTGGLIASVLQSGFPSFQSLCISAIVLIASFHMMTRAAKGYLNVVRFAQIERTLLCWMESPGSEKDKQILFKSIRLYHIEWSAPLSAFVVLGKILFELGFFFQIVACTGVIIYCIGWEIDARELVIVFGTVCFCVFELLKGLLLGADLPLSFSSTRS